MDDEDLVMIDNLDAFGELLDKHHNIFPSWGNHVEPPKSYIQDGSLYCPKCGDSRRMGMIPIYAPIMMRSHTRSIPNEYIPSIYSLWCLQCKTKFTALIYLGPSGPALAILPTCNGGIRTPHTPEGVAYYLDQAYLAHSISANSAAMAMFRGALEHLLYDQGYRDGMLGFKINKLCDDIGNGTAPSWASEVDTEMLEFIKEIGNGSIHPNDGDVNKQKELDNGFMSQMKETFQFLLYLIYEVPHEKKSRTDSFRAKACVFKKKP